MAGTETRRPRHDNDLLYAYSYRRWAFEPKATLRLLLADKLGGQLDAISKTSERERAHYDASTENGVGAPETAFTSAAEMRRMTEKWASCKVERENIGQEWLFKN